MVYSGRYNKQCYSVAIEDRMRPPVFTMGPATVLYKVPSLVSII